MKPAYLINGFLESGKTSFLKFTLQQSYFQIRGTTLLILCEEGEEEIDAKILKKSQTVVEILEEEEDFTSAKLLELEKKWKPERIIIEYNGMWNMKDLALPFHWNLEQQITCIDASTFPMYYNNNKYIIEYNGMWNCKDLVLPDDWGVEQQITTIDATTFPMYYANMKSMVAEMVRKSELIIFNRCDDCMDELASYRRNIKAVNAQAEVIFENEQGEINEIFEEDLPYDLKADHLELDDMAYGIWYLDVMDHAERYLGKTISFVGMALVPPQFPGGCFVPGRMAMTCCADDMAFLGYVCKYDGTNSVKNKQWVKVTVELKIEYWADYKGEGPVLYAKEVVPCEKPANEIISFT